MDLLFQLKATGTGKDKFIRQFKIRKAFQKQAGIVFTLNLIDENKTALTAYFQLDLFIKGPL